MPDHRDRWIPWTATAVAIACGALTAWAAVRNGATHQYYSPAAASMSESLHNLLYGSYDSAGFAGIDKIPGALWPAAASIAVFGYSPASVLLPSALATGLTVALVYLAVARWLGRRTGLVAAVVYAVTPLVVAVGQTNVPEPWFAFWLALAACLGMRSLGSRGLWWLLGAAVAIGGAFQVKMLEAWVLVPAVLITYLVAARPPLVRRLLHVLVAGAVTIVASLWWVALVWLTPAADRPWVGGSDTNSPWEMVFGYNGLGRFGLSSGRSFVADVAGPAGLGRLMGSQVSVDVMWFLPLAVAALVIGLAATARRPRADIARGGYLLFGLWLVPSVLALTFNSGIHTFYVLLFAVPVAALAAAGAGQAMDWFWRGRRWPLALGLLLQAVWTTVLVARAGTHVWTLVVVWIASVAGAVVALIGRRRATIVAAGAALLIAPLIWTISANAGVNAINPSAGVGQLAGPGSGPGGPGGPGGLGGPGDARPVSGDQGPGGPGGPGSAQEQDVTALVDWLTAHEPGSRYLVALSGRSASSLLTAGTAGVLAMGGGFDGSDPTPTAQGLAELVAAGQLRYVIEGQDGIGGPGGPPGGLPSGGPGGSSSGLGGAVASERSAWISANCTAVADAPSTLGTVFDCGTGAG